MIPKIKLVCDPETGKLIPEVWLPIAGYEGSYEVSNYGRVKSLSRISIRKDGIIHSLKEQIRKLPIRSYGYRTVRICKNDGGKTCDVHALVAKAFIENKNKLSHINHKDTIKTNNFYLNLEWVTNRENVSHGLNSKKSRKKTSKYPGVSIYRWATGSKWQTKIQVNGKIITLGKYSSEGDAHKAYLDALDKYGIKNRYAQVA